jgi:uncharacterized membrane protein (DUF106 family)
MTNFLVEFTRNYPLGSIIIYSFIITFFLTWIYKKTTNQTKLKEVRKRTAELRKEIMKNKNDPKKVSELNTEMMQLSASQMKESWKSMFITFLPLLFVFWLLKNLYLNWAVNLNLIRGNIIYWGKDIWLFHDGAGWFLCYIIFSMIFNILLRKWMKVH